MSASFLPTGAWQTQPGKARGISRRLMMGSMAAVTAMLSMLFLVWAVKTSRKAKRSGRGSNSDCARVQDCCENRAWKTEANSQSVRKGSEFIVWGMPVARSVAGWRKLFPFANLQAELAQVGGHSATCRHLKPRVSLGRLFKAVPSPWTTMTTRLLLADANTFFQTSCGLTSSSSCHNATTSTNKQRKSCGTQVPSLALCAQGSTTSGTGPEAFLGMLCPHDAYVLGATFLCECCRWP